MEENGRIIIDFSKWAEVSETEVYAVIYGCLYLIAQ